MVRISYRSGVSATGFKDVIIFYVLNADGVRYADALIERDADACVQIPVVADLPVGENLQDHVSGDGIEFYTPYTGVSISMAHADSFFSTWMYNIFGTGT